MNEFFNNLSDDEFTEFIQSRDVTVDKLKETGKEKEFYAPNMRESMIDTRESMLIEEAMQRHEEMEHTELQMEDISKEFKVFRDPTFHEFIQIMGTKYNEDLPLFA